jgi:O-antigen/teichoic acid export membrane protein
MSGFLLVLSGNFLRLGAGLLVIVLLARQLGPVGFGSFSYGLALATLAVVPLNFGFSTLVLRTFGADPHRRAEVMAEALGAKLLIAAPLFMLSLVAGWLLSPEASAVWMPLLLAQMAESFAEFYQLGFRAADRYKDEARTAGAVALLHVSLMAVTAWQLPVAEICAWAFFGSRLLGLLITAWSGQRAHAYIRPARWRPALQLLRKGTPYATEFGLNTAATQLDAVLIQALLGLRSLGLYQAGMKLVQGLARLAPILALYLLPRLTHGLQARVGSGSAKNQPHVVLTLAIFGGVGAVGGGFLALTAKPLTQSLFGPGYTELAALLPWFGLVLALRFIETGAGLVLVAAGLQGHKVWLVAVQLLILLGLGSWALSRWGLLGWLHVAIGSTLLLLLLYVVLWWTASPSRRPPKEWAR